MPWSHLTCLSVHSTDLKALQLEPDPPRLVLDHLAITARTLDEGVAWVREMLGIEMPPGGAHPRMGTHNRLMALGPSDFLVQNSFVVSC